MCLRREFTSVLSKEGVPILKREELATSAGSGGSKKSGGSRFVCAFTPIAPCVRVPKFPNQSPDLGIAYLLKLRV